MLNWLTRSILSEHPPARFSSDISYALRGTLPTQKFWLELDSVHRDAPMLQIKWLHPELESNTSCDVRVTNPIGAVIHLRRVLSTEKSFWISNPSSLGRGRAGMRTTCTQTSSSRSSGRRASKSVSRSTACIATSGSRCTMRVSSL